MGLHGQLPYFVAIQVVERVHLFHPLLPDFLPYQARRVRHPMVRRLEIPRLKGLFTVGSCSPKTSENMFLLGRNSPNATNNGQKPAVVSQGKYYVSERLAFRWSGIEPKPK